MTATPIHDQLVSALRLRTDEPVVALADDLDDAARAALAVALEEAVADGCPRWGTGYVLLGLLRGGDAVADLLHAAGVTTDAVRRGVAPDEDDGLAAPGRGPGRAAATVVDAARAEARGRRAGTADLLAALLDVRAGAAAGMLATLDVPRDELAAAARTLAARPSSASAPRPWRDPSRLLRRR